MSQNINVAMLDDHQAILDGYLFRLREAPDITVVATLLSGQGLEPLLEKTHVEVLLLDMQIPNSPTDHNPYPVLFAIPRLLQTYPNLKILVISMHGQPAMIQAVLEAGASGYILKEDIAAFQQLASIIRSVAEEGIYLSQAAYQAVSARKDSEYTKPLSGRQLEALSLCAAFPDHTTGELAYKMQISHSTFRNLLSASYLKLNVRNRAAAVLKAQATGLLPPQMTTYDPASG